jgi:hypothetical protein
MTLRAHILGAAFFVGVMVVAFVVTVYIATSPAYLPQ